MRRVGRIVLCVGACACGTDDGAPRTADEIAWSTPIAPALFASSSAPAAVGRGVAVVVADRWVVAFDARSGRQLWRQGDSLAGTSAQAVVSDDVIVLIGAGGGAQGRDLRTGRILWTTTTGGPFSRGVLSQQSGHVWLIAGDDRIVRIRLVDGAWSTVAQVRIGQAGEYLVGALVRGDTVTTLAYREIRSPTLGVGGELWMVHRDAWTGASRGEFRFPMDSIALTAPTALAGPHVVLTDGVRGILHAWDRSTGRLAWSYKVDGNRIMNLVPAVAAGDTVFMAGGPGLHAIDNRTGRLLFLVPSRVSLQSLAVCPDVVYAEGADVDVIDRRTGRSRGFVYRPSGTPQSAVWGRFGVGDGIAFNFLVTRAYAFRCGPAPG